MFSAYNPMPPFARGLFLLISLIVLTFQIDATIESFRFHLGKGQVCFCGFMFISNLILLCASVPRPNGQDTFLFAYLPSLISVIILVLITAVSLGMHCHIRRCIRRTITPVSIKESFDTLSTGMCFYDENGRPLLVNQEMHRLCSAIFGRSLLDCNRFWNDISHGDVKHAIPLAHGEQYVLLLMPDKTVRSFERRQVKFKLWRIISNDITEEYRTMERIQRETERQKALNRRLRDYGSAVNKASLAEANLTARMSIHDNAGKVVLAIRAFVHDVPGVTAANLLESWRRYITMMKSNAMMTPALEESDEALYQAAEHLGIHVTVKGDPPEEATAQKLFYAAAREALTNAVRHANAEELLVHVTSAPEQTAIVFTNDGQKPQGPIVAGGGLSNLRRMVEKEHGTLLLEANDAFRMTVLVPNDIGKDPKLYDKGFDC